MQQNMSKSVKRIFQEFSKVGIIPKMVLKHGFQLFLGLLALGTCLIILNKNIYHYNIYLDLTATSLVKTSFTILAEVVVGSLLMDFISKKI